MHGVIEDVFNGSHYQSLLNTIVPGGEDNPFFYFSDERDIALGLSMDALLHSRNTIRLVGPSYYSTTISILKFSSKRNTAFMLHGPGPQKALGLGLVLLATYSGAYLTRAEYQGIRCD